MTMAVTDTTAGRREAGAVGTALRLKQDAVPA